MLRIKLFTRSICVAAVLLVLPFTPGVLSKPVFGSIPGTFTVTLSGTASYAVPLKIAPGTSGTEPKIQLTYDSQASAGVLGAGWFISGLSVITRGPKEQAIDGTTGGVTLDEGDALYLDGQRIIPVRPPVGSGPARVVEFRKTIDDQTRIFRVGENLENSFFEVQTKGGLTIIFGNLENRAGRPDNSVVRFQDGKVLGFAESLAVDTVGNTIEFRYISSQAGDYNIARIDYTGLGHFGLDPAAGSVTSFVRDLCAFASLDFEYNLTPQRKLESFIAGHRVIQNRQLTAIRSSVSDQRPNPTKECEPNSAESNAMTKQASHYKFEYKNTDTASRFVLRQIRFFGETDDAELNPTEFDYGKIAAGWDHDLFAFPNSAVLAEQGRLGAGYRFGHFTPGPGSATDLLFSVQGKAGLTALAFRNNGLDSGKPLWSPIDSYKPPIPFVDADGRDLGVIVADVVGDGRISLLQSNVIDGVQTAASYLPGTSQFESNDKYKLPFLVSKGGERVASYRFGFWSGGIGPDLIYQSGTTSGFLKNSGPALGWEQDDALAPPIVLDARSHLVDLDCDGGRPALIGSRTMADGTRKWVVFRYDPAGRQWTPEAANAFEPPFPADTDPEAVRQLKIATPTRTCDALIVATAQGGGVHAAYVASARGWIPAGNDWVPASKIPPFDLVDAAGRPSKAIVTDVDGDGRDDVITNRQLADGTKIAFAYRQTRLGWASDAGFVPPPLGNDATATPTAYIGNVDGRPGADIVLLDGAGSLAQDPVGVLAVIFTSDGVRFQPHPDLAGPTAFSRKDKQDLGVRFVDLHGRGLPDILLSRRVTDNGVVKLISGAYRNTGSGWQAEPGDCLTSVEQDPDHPTGLCPPLPFTGEDITGNPVQFVDLDGDGIADMIYSYKDKSGNVTTKFYLNVDDPDRCDGCRRWSNLETEHPKLMNFVRGLDVFPLSSYGIGDMGVRFGKFESHRLGVMVGFRGAGHNECRGSDETPPVCGVGLGLLTQKALVFDGTSWQPTDAYKPPIPFVTQYDNAQGPSIDLAVQIVNVTGGTLPDLVASYTDPIVEHLPWRHDPAAVNHVWVNHGSGWERNDQITLPYALDAAMREPKTLVQLVDVNGDGLPDIVMTKGDNPAASRTWIGTGAGWVERAEWQIPADAISTSDGDPGFRLVDTKGDGFLDVLWMRTNADGSKSKGLRLNNGTDWSARGDDAAIPDLAFTDKDGVDQGVRLLSVTGKGLADVVKAYAGEAPVVEVNRSRRVDVLQTVTDGYRLKTSIFYESLLEADGADPRSGVPARGPLGSFTYDRGSPDAYPLLALIPTMYVVRNAQVDEGDGTVSPIFYRYGGYRVDASLTQALGFKWRESLNVVSQVLNRSEFVQDARLRSGLRREATCIVHTDVLSNWPAGKAFPADLCPQATVTSEWGQKINETRNCWTVRKGDLNHVTNEIYLPDISECGATMPQRPQLGATIHQSSLTKVFSSSYELDGRVVTSEMDTFVLETNPDILTSYGDVRQTISVLADGTSITTDNRYADDPSQWYLGRLITSVVTKVGDPQAGGRPGRKMEWRCTSYGYDATTGLVSDELLHCDNSKAVRTHYLRDRFGNVRRKTVSARGELAQTATLEYDQLGRFVTGATDSFGNRSSSTHSLTFGSTLTTTDVNGLTITLEYDEFARLRRQTSPAKVVTRTDIIDQVDLSKIDIPGLMSDLTATPLYGVRAQLGSLPFTLTLFDRKGRSIRTVSDAFTPDGTTPRYVFKDTRYDRLGNVTQTSLPYEIKDRPLWSTNKYDALNHACASTAPNGLRTETLYTGLPNGGAEVVVVVDPQQQLSGTDVTGRRILACGTPLPEGLYRSHALNQRTSSQIDMRKLMMKASDALGTVSYEYDAGGRLERVTGPTGAVTENIYDELGNKTDTIDPDLGHWKYTYDAFGRVIGQKDAKNQLSTMEYDVGNRPTRRVLQDVTTLWTYDTAKNGIGKVASVTSSNGYGEAYVYDALGRLSRNVVSIEHEQFVTSTDYDQLGRVEKIYYPTSFAVQYYYDPKGFLTEVLDLRDRAVYWGAEDIDVYGHVTKEIYGNGVVTTRTYDGKDLRPRAIKSVKPGDGLVLDLAISYDLIGNLSSRAEAIDGRKEVFCYDQLNRLRSVGNQKCNQVAVLFDAAGRITSKRGTGRYEYAKQWEAEGAYAKPFHAVQETVSGGQHRKYAYDLNGNMVSAPEGRFEYTSENQLSLLYGDESKWTRFDYGPGGDRFRQVSRQGLRTEETIYLGSFERVIDYSRPAFLDDLHPMAVSGSGRLTRYRHFLSNSSGVFAVVEGERTFADSLLDKPKARRAPARLGEMVTQEAWYLHTDQLGSILRITDQDGRIRERLWYDPWGKRDVASKDKPGPGEAQTLGRSWTRGFTGHEQLDTFSLIHMNGRVFNPVLGVFLTVDAVNQMMTDTQGGNGYAYARGNPLRYVDPSGMSFLGDIWHGVTAPFRAAGDAIGAVGRGVGHFVGEAGKWLSENWRAVIIVAVVIVVEVVTAGAATAALGPLAGAILGGMAAGAVGGGLGAALYGGDFNDILAASIKGGVIGAFIGAATYGIGQYFQPPPGEQLSTLSQVETVAAHGVVGGGQEALESGNFWKGFVGAAATTAASSFGLDFHNAAAETAKASLVGGTIAQLNGGKFANGAILAAFRSSFKAAIQNSYEGRGSILGKIWALPNTILGLAVGSAGYAISYAAYELGLQDQAPHIGIGYNSLEFTNNASMFLGGAMTLGNVEIFAQGDEENGLHEMQHTYQAETLGPLYLLGHALSMGAGAAINRDVHGPAGFMETGPQVKRPQPWPWSTTSP